MSNNIMKTYVGIIKKYNGQIDIIESIEFKYNDFSDVTVIENIEASSKEEARKMIIDMYFLND